jgi:flavin-dependent dehydrogenase
VIGADGRNSLVAKAVGAAEYNARPVLTCACYVYWRDVTPHVPATHPCARRVVISFPTNDGLTVTPAVFPGDEIPAVRASLERHLSDALGLVGDFAEPFRYGARVEGIRAMGDLPNFLRKPYGDGWPLVGDAGYHKDPILAQGISDAFRSAEWVADAVHAGFSGARAPNEAMAEYQRVRDEHFVPMYDLTCGMAGLEPPPPEMLALYQALRHDAVERDRYFGTLGGAVPIPEFYAPENVRRIISAACV